MQDIWRSVLPWLPPPKSFRPLTPGGRGGPGGPDPDWPRRAAPLLACESAWLEKRVAKLHQHKLNRSAICLSPVNTDAAKIASVQQE